MFIGEIISLFVALSWTVTALFSEVASKRMGSLPLNVVRMVMSLTFLALTLWLFMGVPWPRYADGQTWLWLLLSSVVGYVIGDYCLFQGYIAIGSRFGQLFMTLSAPTAAITGWLLIGEQMQTEDQDRELVDFVAEVLSQIEERGLYSEVSRVNFANPRSPEFSYGNKYTVVLGSRNNLEHKFGMFVTVLGKLKEGDVGVIDVSDGKTAHFSPN